MNNPTPLQAFNIFAAFGYIGLAMSVMGAVASIQMEVTSPEPISGRDLAAAVSPVIQSLEAQFPKIRITPELTLKLCDAVAAVLNEQRGAPKP